VTQVYSEKKIKILNTALKMASKEGIDGLTIGELAKAVGMSKSGLFAHFGSKDQLQLDVLKRATQIFIDNVMLPAFEQPKGEKRIRALVKNWIQYLNDKSTLPGGSILISASVELDERPGLLRDFVKDAQLNLLSNLEKAAKIGVDSNEFCSSLNCRQFAWELYAYVLGYHHSIRMLRDPNAHRRFNVAFLDLLVRARKKE